MTRRPGDCRASSLCGGIFRGKSGECKQFVEAWIGSYLYGSNFISNSRDHDLEKHKQQSPGSPGLCCLHENFLAAGFAGGEVVGNAKVDHGWSEAAVVQRVMRGEPFLVFSFDPDIDTRLHSKINANSKINHVRGDLRVGWLISCQLILDKGWRRGINPTPIKGFAIRLETAEAPEVSTTCLITTLKKTIDWGIVRIVELTEIDFHSNVSEEVEVAIDTKTTNIGDSEIRVSNGVGGADLQVAKATCSRSGLGCGQ